MLSKKQIEAIEELTGMNYDKNNSRTINLNREKSGIKERCFIFTVYKWSKLQTDTYLSVDWIAKHKRWELNLSGFPLKWLPKLKNILEEK